MTAAVAALPLIRPITELRTQFNDVDVYKRQPPYGPEPYASANSATPAGAFSALPKER